MSVNSCVRTVLIYEVPARNSFCLHNTRTMKSEQHKLMLNTVPFCNYLINDLAKVNVKVNDPRSHFFMEVPHKGLIWVQECIKYIWSNLEVIDNNFTSYSIFFFFCIYAITTITKMGGGGTGGVDKLEISIPINYYLKNPIMSPSKTLHVDTH